MESKFIVLELAGQEVKRHKGLLADVPVWEKQATQISLHCDSQAAIAMEHNSVYYRKRRHIRIRHNAVKQLLKHGVVSLQYVRSEKNLANPLTKELTRRLVLETSRGMGLKLVA